MRMTRLVIVSLTGIMLLSSGASATGLQWGRNGVAAKLPPLNAVGEGRRDFLKWNCYSCHGLNAAGGMGPNIQQADPGDVSEAVLQGASGGMPSFRKYATSKDIANLTAYLKSIGTKSEPTWVDWWNKRP